VLIAYGDDNADTLACSGIRGQLVRLRPSWSGSTNEGSVQMSETRPEPEVGTYVDEDTASRVLDDAEVKEAAAGDREVSAAE
jgi:hypothetical protein